MNNSNSAFAVIFLVTLVGVSGQSYEDKRCRCVCPSPAAALNNTGSIEKKLFIASVPPSQCNCDGVILSRVKEEVKGREQEYCLRCECLYETRNTAMIKVVVIMVVWILTLLLVYMAFLICLDPLKNKKNKYREIGTDEARNLLSQTDDI